MAKRTDLRGLTQKQAQERLARAGENVLSGKKEKSAIGMFLGQFKDILILILAAATLLSVIIGQMTEAITIITIVLMNAFMGFIQEYRTEKTIQSLKHMTAPVARVYRDGELVRIPASGLVPEDMIEIKAGDRIPADCLLLEGAGLKTDESILTGEADPVTKQAGLREHSALYMGTSVLTGHGTARVEKTGMATEMGGIAALIDDAKEEPTPLQRRLASLGTFVAITCISCGIIVAVLGLLRGGDLLEMLLVGISLAVAAIPEGLPAIVTIVLALSVNRILARGAIIRKLHAVETLGSASVICSDKTGTITENRMSVTEIYCEGRRMKVTGGARSLTGAITVNGAPVKPDGCASLTAALTAAALCSGSSVTPEGDKLEGVGNPTEVALLCVAYRAGIKREALAREFHVVDELPFDATRKMMSVLVRHGEENLVMVKGAPDILLGRCAHIGTATGIRRITANDRALIIREVDRMAGEAQRVIAVAVRKGALREEELTFLALFGMKDPPRREVRAAVRRCREAGIKPVMITGDYAATARAIAREVGILRQGDRVIEGSEIDHMDEAQLRAAVRGASVFARVTPKHKLDIVRAFKQNGEIVAMTGDGVNDAPAIKEADIGVAMGIAGSDVTKEASSVVILDDNFATIVAAVEEGRIIYQNIKRFIRFLLTSNLGEVVTIVAAMLMGMPAIFIPIQILLINLVTDGLPAVALGMEPAGKDIMSHPPRPANESLFAGGMIGTILFRGVVLGLSNILCFAWVLRATQGDLVVARSAAFITLVVSQMLHVVECKMENGIRNTRFFQNKTLLVAITLSVGVALACVYLPFLQAVFKTAAVSGPLLLPVAACTVLSPILGFISQITEKWKRKK